MSATLNSLPGPHLLRLAGLCCALALAACSGKDGGDSGADDGGSGDEGSDGSDPDTIDRDGDGFVGADDCDDTNAARNPDAPEYCNGVDDNCNGEIDDGIEDMPVWYEDRDGDGRGDPETAVEACVQPYGLVDDDTDCDDTSSVSYPGASELCDGRDNDCDDEIDEGTPSNALAWYDDADGDGYGAGSVVARACEPPSDDVVARTGDCDDSDPYISPSADEVLDDEVDNNCDGWTDLIGRYAGRTTLLAGQDRPSAGDYDCSVYWDSVGPVLTDPADLCYDCDFGFELTLTPDLEVSDRGSCYDEIPELELILGVGNEAREDGYPVYYQFSYGYYGYTYVYWELLGYAELEGVDVHWVRTNGYVDRYDESGYDTNYFSDMGSIY